MKTIVTLLTFTLATTFTFSQNDVNLSASENWIGYMNVFNLPSDGGAYQFGSGWGLPDLKTTVDVAGNTLTLQPNFNTYNDNPTDPYWVNQSTGEGNKDMEGSTFVEPGPTFNDNDLTFHGDVTGFTIDTAQYDVYVFIKALDSTNGWQDAFGGQRVKLLDGEGAFTISATAAELPSGLVIQYGFIVRGRNGNPAEEAQLGSVVVAPEYPSNEVDFDAADTWIGYMNVFDLPSAGGAYQFGSQWAVADMQATLTDDAITNTLELQPNFNTYADNPTDPFWVDQSTGAGNKFMEASTFVEPGASFNESHVTFRGDIYSYDLVSDYSVEVFIKALDPNNGYQDALGGSATMPLPTSGSFEVSAAASDLAAGLIIQYGFTVKGPNANPLQEDSLGSAVIGTSSLSIEELKPLEVQLYPNPASDEVYISTSAGFEGYEVLDLSGKLVSAGTTNKVLLTELPTGLYMVRVNTSSGVHTSKLIKQ